MSKAFKFALNNVDSLYCLIKTGILGVTVESRIHARSDVIWLVLKGNQILKIQSVVSSIDSWDEIGSLVFQLVNDKAVIKEMERLGPDWLQIEHIEKLVYQDERVKAESGLAIKNKNGEEITILSSSFPYAIEINATFHTGSFEPECDIKQYSRLALIA